MKHIRKSAECYLTLSDLLFRQINAVEMTTKTSKTSWVFLSTL